ncbi:hypothetical protein SUGI_1150940 [Cryptomeria japonica]|nr:hypothetical protein SUGI_1150940 [Cryptomeria japonica]
MKYFLPSRCLGSPCDYNPFTTHTWANSQIWQPRFFHGTQGRNSTPDSATKEWRRYGQQSVFGPEHATNQFSNPIMDDKQWKMVTYRKNRRTANYRPNVRSFGRNLGMGDRRYPIPTANNFNHLQDKKEVKEEPKFAKHEKARSIPKANVYSPLHRRPLYPNPQEAGEPSTKPYANAMTLEIHDGMVERTQEMCKEYGVFARWNGYGASSKRIAQWFKTTFSNQVGTIHSIFPQSDKAIIVRINSTVKSLKPIVIKSRATSFRIEPTLLTEIIEAQVDFLEFCIPQPIGNVNKRPVSVRLNNDKGGFVIEPSLDPNLADQENGKLDEIPTVDQIKEVGDVIVDDFKRVGVKELSNIKEGSLDGDWFMKEVENMDEKFGDKNIDSRIEDLDSINDFLGLDLNYMGEDMEKGRSNQDILGKVLESLEKDEDANMGCMNNETPKIRAMPYGISQIEEGKKSPDCAKNAKKRGRKSLMELRFTNSLATG